MVDGKIFCVFGVNTQLVFQNLPYMYLIYSVGPASKWRIKKLALHCIVSEEMYHIVWQLAGIGLRKWDSWKTLCLCKHPEVKTHRGISKIENRERMKDGTYRILYNAPVTKLWFKDCLAKWLKGKHKDD